MALFDNPAAKLGGALGFGVLVYLGFGAIEVMSVGPEVQALIAAAAALFVFISL